MYLDFFEAEKHLFAGPQFTTYLILGLWGDRFALAFLKTDVFTASSSTSSENCGPARSTNTRTTLVCSHSCAQKFRHIFFHFKSYIFPSHITFQAVRKSAIIVQNNYWTHAWGWILNVVDPYTPSPSPAFVRICKTWQCAYTSGFKQLMETR